MKLSVVLVVAFVPAVGMAQRAPVVSLPPPEAKLEEEFTAITSVRELRDGRVLVTDPRDKNLVVADFRTGTVEPIGRKGQGPGEYSVAAPLRALPGDSSLLADNQARRWLLLDGARIVATVPTDAPAIVVTRGILSGVDSQGHAMTRHSAPPDKQIRDIGKGDSTRLVLVSRKTGSADTVAAIRMAPAQLRGTTNAKGEITSMSVRRPPLTVGEDALLAADGWIAIARLEPFRVDWRSPDGAWVRGSPLPVPEIRMNDREKRAHMERIASGTNAAPKSPDTQSDWPDVLPPYSGPQPLMETPDRRLLILRQRSADFPETRYFVVNRRGVLEAEIKMPETERIVGFGARSVYTAVTDDDGIQRLRRHPWPADRPLVP